MSVSCTTKIAIPPGFLPSSIVKDTEMTKKREPHHPVMDDTTLGEH